MLIHVSLFAQLLYIILIVMFRNTFLLPLQGKISETVPVKGMHGYLLEVFCFILFWGFFFIVDQFALFEKFAKSNTHFFGIRFM